MVVQLLTLGDVDVGVGGCHNDGSKHNASCHGQGMLQAHDCSQQNWQRLIDSKERRQPVCGILSAVRPFGLQPNMVNLDSMQLNKSCPLLVSRMYTP